MKTMLPPGCHHSVSVATHTLGHMMYGSQADELPQGHCDDNWEGTLFS